MKSKLQEAAFFILVALAVWLLITTVQSFGQRGPDRAAVFQVPLFLAVLGLAGIAYRLSRMHVPVSSLLPAVQLGVYILYETGVSIQSSNRVDLLIIYVAIVYSIWRALVPEPSESGSE